MAKKFFGNFLPTRQNTVSKIRYKKNLKKIFNPKFCDEIHQYFNFKNEFLGSKNSEIVVFIVKILQGKELLLKIKREKWKKWLWSPLKIHVAAKNSKCCISAAGKDISKTFFAIIIFQCLSHMWKLAKSMTSGYKVSLIINGLPHKCFSQW